MRANPVLPFTDSMPKDGLFNLLPLLIRFVNGESVDHAHGSDSGSRPLKRQMYTKHADYKSDGNDSTRERLIWIQTSSHYHPLGEAISGWFRDGCFCRERKGVF